MTVVVEQVRVEVVRPLRAAVLRPGRPLADAVFGCDDHPDAAHFAAYADGQVVGVASVAPEDLPDEPGGWRLRGMAVAETHQGHGTGAALLLAVVEHAARLGGATVWCNARTTAIGFYERHGFVPYGPEFVAEDTGIPHVPMRRDLR